MSNFTRNALRLNFSKTLSQICGIQQSSKSSLNQNIIIFNMRYMHKQGNHKPNTLEKYMLVWMKKFPSVAEVPKTVSNDMMERTRNWVRIKVNIFLCILTAVACGFLVYSGKQAAKRGESIDQMNKKWHAEYNAKKE